MYREIFPGVEAAGSVRPQEMDALVFDVDGVLIDVGGSFTMACTVAVRHYLERLAGWTDGGLLQTEDVELFKKAGGFNDDWDLTCAAVLFFLFKEAVCGSREPEKLLTSPPTLAGFTEEIRCGGGGGLDAAVALTLGRLDDGAAAAVRKGWRREDIISIFQEIYAGSDLCAEIYGHAARFFEGLGLIRTERPLLLSGKLSASSRRLGIYSGRTRGEMKAALGLLGAEALFSAGAVLTVEDGKKPDPAALERVMKHLDSRFALYVGDTGDDLRTVRNLTASGGRASFAAVLTGQSGRGDRDYFRHLGADIIADDVNVLLSMLEEVPYEQDRRDQEAYC